MSAEIWNERYASKDYVWTITVNQFVEANLADLEPGTAIDLGAGEGRNAVWLATLGWQVAAVDYSPVGLEKGRRLAADHEVEDKIDFIVGDAVEWQPTEPVDLVVLSYLQLPEDQRAMVLEHAAGWLRPGGTVFVIAHDVSNVADGYGGPPTTAVCYTVDECVAAFAGLEITTAEVAERHVDTPNGVKVALDTLVIAKLSPEG
jgi:SAM-dependent methyltransferase